MITGLEKYGTIRYNEPLKNRCTWRIGGSADALIEPADKEKLESLIEFLTGNKIPWFVIGAGSNVLFEDKGFRGVIIKVARNLSNVSIIGDIAICEAGIWMPILARKLG